MPAPARRTTGDTTLTDVPPNQVIAMLLATGKYTVLEIARQLVIPPSRVYALKASPMFQRLVTQWAERFQAEAIDDVIREIQDDALTNVRFLKNVRDGAVAYDNVKEMPFRMQAAAMLFERQVPKRAATDDRPPAVVIHIGAERKARIDVALAEAEGDNVLDITDLGSDE